MTSLALASRSSSGLRLIWMRPVFTVVLVPSTPMNEERLATAGSARITRASACCRAVIARKETSCEASEMPRITPVSWIGKNPLGMNRKSRIVATRVPAATSSVSGWWSSTQTSVRS